MRPGLKLGLIIATCAAPFVLAWLAHEYGWMVSGPTSNYGELLEPRPIGGALTPLRGKWVLVTADAAACSAACERKLYIVRQVRKAQGKDMERVDRLWLLTDRGKPRAELVAALDGGHIAAADVRLLDEFPNIADIYLVDPLGNLMMRFPAEPDPEKMIKDLQRLLKYSGFG